MDKGKKEKGVLRPHAVCRSVTLVSPAKTAEPIEMLFGLRTLVGSGTSLDLPDLMPWRQRLGPRALAAQAVY